VDRIHAAAGRRRHRRVSMLHFLSLKRVLTVIVILWLSGVTSYKIIKCSPNSDALTELGLERYCCRRMVLTHVDLIEKLLKYNRESMTKWLENRSLTSHQPTSAQKTSNKHEERVWISDLRFDS
jgi:DNA-directed RNA polymerase subunit N (RpoN/RPB10)